MRKLMYQVSLFTNTWSKTSTTISIEDFFAMVRNGHWKVPAEGHRNCLAKDRKHDAQTIKDSMACVIPAGVCKNGHAKNNLTSLSLALCIDIDHTDEQTKDIFVRACLLEYVLGAFTSISGRGVKLFIRIEIDGVNDYPAIYEATAKLVSFVLGVENDGKCKDITHPCFGSYDPDAYYNGDAKAVNDFLPERVIHNGNMATLPNVWPGNADRRPPILPANSGSSANGVISAAAFAQSFLNLYPAVKGDRHGSVFRLSCEAWKRGIHPDELVSELVRMLEEADFREMEIRRTVKSAYQHKEQVPTTGNTPKLSANCQTALLDKVTVAQEDRREEQPSGEELRALTPTFPDEIYDWIPGIFAECVRMAQDKRERDGLLLASVTTISSMLPTVSCRYNRRKYGTNLCSIIIAPSGNSKGIFAYGLRLHKGYYAYWEKLNAQAEATYQEECRKYEQAQQQARRGQGGSGPKNGERMRAPEEPKLLFPMIPPDISKAKLIQHLINNKKCSSLLASTEITTLSTARGRDYGQFDDVFCKSFEHEPVSSSYKITGQRPLQVERPYLSTFFTTTPAGLLAFTPSAEQGLYSRQLLYTFCQPVIWQNVFAEEEETMDDLFDLLSIRFCRMALFLMESPTIITLTAEQKRIFNERFTKLLAETDLLGNDDLLSVVKRHGVMAVRLCMIFTAIDKATLGMDAPTAACSDAHFKAALAIVECCLEHSKLLISSLKSSSEEIPPLQAANHLQLFFNNLPTEFTTEMAMGIGQELDISERCVYRILRKAVRENKINKLSHGLYHKMTQEAV